MGNMNEALCADPVAPLSPTQVVERVLANAERALVQQRENIAALTETNVRLMVACLERDRTIHELREALRRRDSGES